MTEEQTKGWGDVENHVVRHFRFGWWSLLFFLSLGIVLEALHGFKIGWYLDVGNETRQMMGRLSHAHGTLLAVVNIVFALTLRSTGNQLRTAAQLASPCLMSAAILMPLGFLLGGIVIYGGDPGLGIFLVPIGGVLLLLGVFSVAWGLVSTPAPLAGGSPAAQAGAKPKRKHKR